MQQQIFKALDSAAQTNTKVTGPGAGISFTSLHKTWYERFFEEMNDNLQTFIQAKVDKEVTLWTGGSGAYGLYKSAQRNAVVASKFPCSLLRLMFGNLRKVDRSQRAFHYREHIGCSYRLDHLIKRYLLSMEITDRNHHTYINVHLVYMILLSIWRYSIF